MWPTALKKVQVIFLFCTESSHHLTVQGSDGAVTESLTKAEKQQLIHIQNAVFSALAEIGSM